MMKNFKSLFCLSLISLACMSGYAQLDDDGDMLYVYTSASSDAVKYECADLDKITFGDKGVQLWNTAWPTEYPYGKISVISFRERKSRPTGLHQAVASDNRLSIGYDGSSSLVTVRSGVELISVSVYNMQGVAMLSLSVSGLSCDVSLRDIPQGIYVVKVKGEGAESSRKVVKK